MEIFQVLRRKLMLLSINPNELHRFNWKIQMSFLMLGYSILSNIVFIFFTANVTLMDRVKVFCIISELTKLGICLAAVVQRQKKLFGIIENVEKLANESKLYINLCFWNKFEKKISSGLKYETSKAIYEDTHRQAEKMCSILYFGFVRVLPQCVIWPKFVLSFVKYFATDLNGDAFELPIPVWYASFYLMQSLSTSFQR